jgi:hypothetical protein
VGSNMKTQSNRRRLVSLGVASVCTLAVALFLLSWGRKTHAESHQPVHMTTDWSNRHMVYSAPSSIGQALRLQAEPRYLHQWARRNVVPSQAQSAK